MWSASPTDMNVTNSKRVYEPDCFIWGQTFSFPISDKSSTRSYSCPVSLGDARCGPEVRNISISQQDLYPNVSEREQLEQMAEPAQVSWQHHRTSPPLPSPVSPLPSDLCLASPMSSLPSELCLASPVSWLPPELLTLTFQFLPFADLKNASLVCRLVIHDHTRSLE